MFFVLNVSLLEALNQVFEPFGTLAFRSYDNFSNSVHEVKCDMPWPIERVFPSAKNFLLIYLFIFFLFAFFRVVKEEIVEDDSKLPCFNGRVVSWVCAAQRDNGILLVPATFVLFTAR